MRKNASKVLFPVLVLFLGLDACSLIDDQDSDSDWIPLFDGKTLNDWRTEGSAIWQVIDGNITTGEGAGNGFLVRTGSFADFHLSLEFWVDDKVNSGIFVRCADGEDISPVNCYEANIWDNHPNQASRTGAIVMKAEPLAHVDTIGKWNTYEIVAIGNSIKAIVNGIVTVRLKDDSLKSGSIALQRFNDGQVKFRNVKIKSY